MKPIGTLPYGWSKVNGFANAFRRHSPYDRTVQLRVIITDHDGWDHISISTEQRCPTWEEMEFVKRSFAKPNETFMQLHVPLDDHVNIHSYCLHLWRPNDGREIPRPDKGLI